MMELTKGNLKLIAKNKPSIYSSLEQEMARQLLAGLEQEPVAYMYRDKLHSDARFSLDKRFGNWSQEDINEYEITEIPLYAAPQLPQPAVVSDVTRKDFEAWARAAGFNEDWYFFTNVHPNHYDDDHINDMWAAWSACRAAMLQGAEPVSQTYTLPFEQWLSQQTGTIDVECGCVMTEVFYHWLRVAYEAGNSPLIHDGWVAVPVDMVPEQMRAVQINSELGAYAAANLSGAYSLFREFWGVACSAAGNYPATPEGYVLVPIEPTAEMCDVKHVGVDVYTGIAADEYYSIGGEDAAKVWKAMLAAAPNQEAK